MRNTRPSTKYLLGTTLLLAISVAMRLGPVGGAIVYAKTASACPFSTPPELQRGLVLGSHQHVGDQHPGHRHRDEQRDEKGTTRSTQYFVSREARREPGADGAVSFSFSWSHRAPAGIESGAESGATATEMMRPSRIDTMRSAHAA